MIKKRKSYIKSYPLTPLRFVSEKQTCYERICNFIFWLVTISAFVLLGVPILVHLATWVWPGIEFKDSLSPLWLEKILPNHPFQNLYFATTKEFNRHEYFNLLWAMIPGSLFALSFWFGMKTVSMRSPGFAFWRFLGFTCLGAFAFAALYFFFFLFENQKLDYLKVSRQPEKEEGKLINVIGTYALKTLGWIICLFFFILPFGIIVCQSLIYVGYKQFTIDYRYRPLVINNKKMVGKPQPDNFFFEHCRNIFNLPPVFSRQNLDANYQALQNFYAETSEPQAKTAKAKETRDLYYFLRPYCFDNQSFKNHEGLPSNELEIEEKH
ncbi:hypothetical protein [Entomoplasma freundtii]|nr:hypothetical protein [Entomoplasma freundtii]